MEMVYKKGSRYFGMSSGLEYPKDAVTKTGDEDYWRVNPDGLTVRETYEPGGRLAEDTRLNEGGYQKGNK